MGLMERLLSLVRAPVVQYNPQESELLAKLLPLFGGQLPPRRGTRGLLEAFSTSPWVRATVAKVSDQVGATQWYLFGMRSQRTGRWVCPPHVRNRRAGTVKALSQNAADIQAELVPILDHPFLRLWNGSNPVYPGHVGRSLTQVSLELTGEAYWLLDPMDAPVPEAYWYLPPHWITRFPTTGSPYWRVESPYWKDDLPAGAVLRFCNPDPLDPYGRGSGIMGALGDEIDVDEFASKHIRAWFTNRAIPDLLIYGEDLDTKETDRLEAKWLGKLRSFRNAHRPFFLRTKGLTVKELSQRFVDMELSQLRKDERDHILHVPGFPPEVFGILESSNRSTIDAADYLMAKYMVLPRLELMRAVVERFLLPHYDDRLLVAYESPVEEDSQYQLEVMKAAPWAFSSNDWRRLATTDEVPPEQDVYAVPFNVRLVPTLAPPPAVEAPATPAAPAAAAVSPAVARALETAAELRAAIGKGSVGGEEFMELALQLSEDMRRAVLAAWEDLRNAVSLDQLTAAVSSGEWQGLLDSLDEAARAGLEDAVAVLRQAVVIVGQESAAALGAFLQQELTFELVNPEAVAELERVGAAFVTNVSDETMEAIRQALVYAYEDGRTAAQVARELRDLIGLTERDIQQFHRIRREMLGTGVSEAEVSEYLRGWTRKKIAYRARVIAENELVQAGNKGQEMLWHQAQGAGLLPQNTLREWIVTLDDKLCEICMPMAGAKTPVGMPWETSKGPVLTPNEIHVRCRCSERLVFPT